MARSPTRSRPNGTAAIFETADGWSPGGPQTGTDIYARDPNGALRLVSSGTSTSGDSFFRG